VASQLRTRPGMLGEAALRPQIGSVPRRSIYLASCVFTDTCPIRYAFRADNPFPIINLRHGHPPAFLRGMKTQMEEQIKKLAAVTSVMMMAAIEAMAQDNTAKTTRRVVVSLPDRKLAVIENDRVIRVFNVAVGASQSPSPTGVFKVVNHIENPTWYYHGKVVGPGTNNPVGTRWMGISAPGYGIHGTNVPSSIGKNASHGCIRLKNSDVEQLFKLVQVGDQVELYGEPPVEIAALFVKVTAVTGDN
jgi:lipoprotein-anchoring transpeptidase ErfK/SrfK